MAWYFLGTCPIVNQMSKTLFYLDGTSVWVDWFWWLICLNFHFNLVTRFWILPSRIAIHVVSSRDNFTIKWVHFINVLWYKEACSLTDFRHKISKTISELSNSNANQKQAEIEITGTISILLLFYFFLNTILNRTANVGVSELFWHIFLKKESNIRERIIWMIMIFVMLQKLEIWEIFTKKWQRRTMESLIIKFHRFYLLHLVVLIRNIYH